MTETGLEPVNYEQVGFKSGVEIHQQILTEKKMFCRCPAGRYSKEYDAQLLRHMRPTMSEMGTYDGTALMEFKTKKEVLYQINGESVCTYELDDTPPFLVNQQGLDIAIEIALLLHCKLVDEMFVTRKQYLDGSIPAGFQRTAIIGVDGWIPYKGRKIGIIQLGYEEDSCREVSDIGHRITFRTDRLSMPLIEVVTQPQMHTPEEAAEVVRVISRLLRATGKIRRGLGSVRQDVNVSIDGSTRVETKGVSKIGYIPTLLRNEAIRHQALLQIRDALTARQVTEVSLATLQTADLTDLFLSSESTVLRACAGGDNRVRAIRLPGFGGLLNRPVQENTPFADEFAGRVRVVACLDMVPNLIQTDDPKLPCLDDDAKAIRDAVGAEPDDVAVVVWGPEADTETALEEIRLRAIDALHGVPGETRQLIADGRTAFERILPGPDRMYPDTDSPPTQITADRVAWIEAALPERPWDREARYETLGIPLGVAAALAIHEHAAFFDRVVNACEVNPTLVAVTLTETLKALRRKGVVVTAIPEAHLTALFRAVADGTLPRNGIAALLRRIAEQPDTPVAELLEPVVPSKTMEAAVKNVLSGNSFSGPRTEMAVHYYIGKVLRGIDGFACSRSVAQSVEAKVNG